MVDGQIDIWDILLLIIVALVGGYLGAQFYVGLKERLGLKKFIILLLILIATIFLLILMIEWIGR